MDADTYAFAHTDSSTIAIRVTFCDVDTQHFRISRINPICDIYE